MVIWFRENDSCDLVQISEDISCAGVIFAALVPGTKLSIRHEQVDIIRADEILRHINDRHGKRHLPMVVCRMLSHVTRKLRHLYLVFEVPLEAGVDDLALARLEPIDDGANRPLVVLVGEMDELLIDELLVADRIAIVEHDDIGVVVGQPVLPLLRVLLVEDQVDGVVVLVALVDEVYPVALQLLEVLLRLFVR